MQKCASCGFPVSEGRTLCLDCEKKGTETKSEGKTPDKIEGILHEKAEEPAELTSKTADEFVPAFLANSEAAQEIVAREARQTTSHYRRDFGCPGGDCGISITKVALASACFP